jgi:hypothetical protein
LLLKSVPETDGKVAERLGSIRMTRGAECKCSSIKVNGLIYVRHDTTVVESVPETPGRVTERQGSITMTRWMENKCNPALLNNVCH